MSWRDAPLAQDQEPQTPAERAVGNSFNSWMNAPMVDEAEPMATQTQPELPPAQEPPSMTAPTGRLMPLQPPSAGMYSGLSFEESTDLYNRYRGSEDATRGFMGELIYDNTVVPFPERGLFNNNPGIPQYTAGIVRNTARNLMETAGAVSDFARSRYRIFDDDGNFAPKVGLEEVKSVEPGFLSRTAQGMARFKAGDSLGSEMAVTGGEFMMGGIGGLKIADKLISSMKPLTDMKTLRSLAKFLGFEIGGVSTLDSDTTGFVLGEGAMFENDYPLLRGARPGADDAEYEKILKTKMNLLAEGVLIGKGIEGTAKAVTALTTTLWSLTLGPVIGAFRKNSLEDRLVRDIANKLDVTVSKDGVVSSQAKIELHNLIQDNYDLILKMGDDFGPDIEMSLDIFTAIERAVRNNDTELARQLADKAKTLRTGIQNQAGGATQLTDRIAAPPRELENLTQTGERVFGGEEAIQQSGRRLVRDAQDEVAQFTRVADDIDLRIADAEEAFERSLREDPTFGARLQNLNETSGVMVYSGPSQTMDNILGNVRQAYEVMTARKNELFGRIRGGEVDPVGLLNKLDDLRPGQLDAVIQETSSRDTFGTLLEASRRRSVQEADSAGNMVTRPETDEERILRFSNWMDENGLDYGKLYREVRPSISKIAEDMAAAKKPGYLTLRDFNRYIDEDALVRAQETAPPDLAQNIAEAMEYYTRDWAPFWKQGVLAEFGEAYSRTVGRTTETTRRLSGADFRNVDFEDAVVPALENAISGNRPARAGHLIKLLDRPEAGQNAPLVTDYIIGRAVDTIDDALAVGGRLSDMDMAPLVRELRSYRDIVSKNFPDQAQRINQFVDNIAQSRNNIQALRSQLDEARQIAKQAEESLQNGALSRFFRSQGVENPDIYNVLSGIFSDNQSADVLAELVRRADATGDPLVRDGMKAAYMRFVRENFLGSSQELGGNRAFKLGAFTKEEQGVTNVFEYGDIIFSDRPELMESLRTIAELSGFMARSKGAKSVATDSNTATRMEAMRAANQMITQTFGVLNRIGAKIRAGSTALIDRALPADAGARLTDAIVSDTPEFLRILERVIGQDRRRNMLLGYENPEVRDLMWSFLVRSNIYNQDDYESFVLNWAQSEMEMRQRVDNLGGQMEDMLFPRGQR